jgi:hypothetical protein
LWGWAVISINAIPAAETRQGQLSQIGHARLADFSSFFPRVARCDRHTTGHFQAGSTAAEPVRADANAAAVSSLATVAMPSVEFLPTKEAARRLGITVTTLYDWLGQSDHGLLVIRGQSVTIRYLQSGANGHGKIQIESSEIDRLRELMRVVPQKAIPRRHRPHSEQFPGITVPLGRPEHRS